MPAAAALPTPARACPLFFRAEDVAGTMDPGLRLGFGKSEIWSAVVIAYYYLVLLGPGT